MDPRRRLCGIVLQGSRAKGLPARDPCSCRDLIRGSPTEDPTGIVIHPFLYLLDLLHGDLVKVGAFGEEASNDSVVILDAAFFPCAVTVTIVDVEAVSFTAISPPQQIVFQKFTPVVGGDAAELLPEVGCFLFQPVYSAADGVAFRSGSFMMIS